MNYKNLAAWIFILSLFISDAEAQRPLIRGGDAPGATAFKRLIAEPSIAGYEQPVQIVVADGGQVEYWDQGYFSQCTGPDSLLGLQVGPIFRVKVSAIFRGREKTVYPTIEMVDRTYPPQGLKLSHPVKIVIAQEDIEDAAAGKMVTKVVYLEAPDTALPYRQQLDHQATLDVGSGRDPYQVADRLGRPMAIVRIGSRQPMAGDTAHSNALYQYPVRLFTAPLQLDNISSIDNGKNEIRKAGNQVAVEAVDCLDCGAPAVDSQTSCGNACVPATTQPTYSCSPEVVARLPKHRRDEFVCDGNDRGMQVVADLDWKLRGLDIEDTIAHFDTLDGKVKVAPSNRVCIYSPRFAAVRRVLTANHETINQKLVVSNQKTPVVQSRKRDFSTTTLQNIQPQSNKKTERVNAFRDRTRGVATEKTIKLVGTRHYFKPFEDFQLTRFGKFDSSESARLGLAIQSAIVWESDVSAQITVNRQQPVIVNDVIRTRDFIAVDSKTSADLRLCKLASTISAQPGEIIDFTIRFDNIGRELIGNVTIIDNLSPRLEYVDGSSECSVKAELKTETNEVGSLILRWEITDPLAVRKGGLIRFRCRVR